MIARTWLLLTVAAFACSQQARHDDQAVKNTLEGIIDADNRGDINQVLSFYTENAVLVPPGRPEIAGTSNIRTNYENIFATSSLNLRIRTDSVVILDKNARAYGITYGQVTSIADGNVRDVNDSFVIELERSGDAWKITRLTWSPQ